jgi:sigma-B regulation protein RsbU (phosphoserine phosphatase)
VSGKGAPAALMTAVIQGMFTVQAPATIAPAETLLHINRGLVRRAVEGKFVTMFYATISPDGTMCCCNGGHNAPFLLKRDQIVRLETGGMILGMFGKASYEQETLSLDPGDTIVIFSDGVSEAASVAGEEYGDDRMIEFLEANRTASPAELRDGLIASVREFTTGAPQGDDVTVLVVRYGG